jgi:hypothetical protein
MTYQPDYTLSQELLGHPTSSDTVGEFAVYARPDVWSPAD